MKYLLMFNKFQYQFNIHYCLSLNGIILLLILQIIQISKKKSPLCNLRSWIAKLCCSAARSIQRQRCGTSISWLAPSSSPMRRFHSRNQTKSQFGPSSSSRSAAFCWQLALATSSTIGSSIKATQLSNTHSATRAIPTTCAALLSALSTMTSSFLARTMGRSSTGVWIKKRHCSHCLSPNRLLSLQ